MRRGANEVKAGDPRRCARRAVREGVGEAGRGCLRRSPDDRGRARRPITAASPATGAMISTAHHFIFIHAPKTGGNSIQLVLEPLSDDRRTVNARQDGRNRFGVEGPITPGKHARLADYQARLGEELGNYRVVTGSRDPLDRAVSAYYSPHRWAGRPPTFDRVLFERAMARLPSITAMLTIAGAVRRPDHTLRFESLAADLAIVARALDLPPLAPLPHVNASAADSGLRAETLADPWVRSLVAERYAEDYDLFGYSRP